MEGTVIRFQEPSNALGLFSHFVKKIDQTWVLLVGSNSVVARAIYGSTQAMKRRIPSLVLAWSLGSVITFSLLLSKVKRNKHSHRRQVIASQQPASTSNGSMQQWRSPLSCIRVRSSVTAII